jgi:hypothetical protein
MPRMSQQQQREKQSVILENNDYVTVETQTDSDESSPRKWDKMKNIASPFAKAFSPRAIRR